MWAGFYFVAAIAVVAAPSGDAVADFQQEFACPSPAEIKSELVRVGAVGALPPRIELDGDRMRVVLHDRRGVAVGTRDVEAPPTCHERATAAAVLVATWMGIWPQAPGLAESSRAAVDESRSAVGVTVAGAYDGNAPALGLAIDLRRRVRGSLWGMLAVSGTTARERSVGEVAKAVYLRPAVDLGPALRLGRGLQVDVAASGRLGLVIVYGKGLPVSHTKLHVIPGVAANLRVIVPGKRFSPFVAAGGTWWFGTHNLTIDDVQATADLPRWDLAAGLGFYWSP